MGNRLYGVVGIIAAVVAGVAIYRGATAGANEDNTNYEVTFEQLPGWKNEDKKPNTLLLIRDPKSRALLRASATQVVDEENPEPDVDTKAIVARTIRNAQENQPEWKTDPIGTYKTSHAEFGLFRKSNPGKTIIIAMAVKGNTTFVASLSNFGEGGKELASGKYQPLLAFLDTVRLTATDKWIKIHEKYDRMPN